MCVDVVEEENLFCIFLLVSLYVFLSVSSFLSFGLKDQNFHKRYVLNALKYLFIYFEFGCAVSSFFLCFDIDIDFIN